MKPWLAGRNIGRRVRLVSGTDAGAVGTVTIDLRHENQQPPLAHVSLYVRWDTGRLIGDWFGAAGVPLELLECVRVCAFCGRAGTRDFVDLRGTSYGADRYGCANPVACTRRTIRRQGV